eukprot:m.278695 g.278695  ORF g.278695 m.278695 type:complete len:461 (+) comp11102_c1_seq1:963-2345(+)
MAAQSPPLETLLRDAAAQGNQTQVDEYLKHGAAIDFVDSEQRTALHFAIASNCRGVAKLLIERGADINCKDKRGVTPLHSACFGGCRELAQLLLSKGADLAAVNQYGKTPLHDAADQGHHDIVQDLLDLVADRAAACGDASEATISDAVTAFINTTDKEKRTALQLAKSGNHHRVETLLIEHGADIKCQDQCKETLLYSGFEATIETPIGWRLPAFRASNVNVRGRKYLLDEKSIRLMQDFLNKMAKPACHGKYGKYREQFDEFEVAQVWRLEHSMLWMKYVAKRHEIICSLDRRGVSAASGDDLPRSCEFGHEKLLKHAGEAYGFHGTSPQVVSIVGEHGFDEHIYPKDTDPYLHGPGIYFAESPSKADQYARPESCMHWIILSRIVLGHVFHAKRKMGGRVKRPPCMQGCEIFENCEHARHDSVVTKEIKDFREFVVYHGAQTYPEFLIKYRRRKVQM